jgi:glutamine cyclotransferase
MHRFLYTTVCLLALFFLASSNADIPTLSWELLRAIPREPGHFTQGLAYGNSQLFESTGHYGKSRLITYDAKTLTKQKEFFLRKDVFGEGLTFLNNKVYQCSWKSQELFTYGTDLELLRTLPVDGESWGLTTDGTSLIMSNGSSNLLFLDPASGQTLRVMPVKDSNGRQWQALNELEWINGRILANVWHENVVLVIDSGNGQIIGKFDFSHLDREAGRAMSNKDSEQVLNGMAWNQQTQTLLVTGKDWPLWFELKITLH